jgi:DNA polymerase-3 subunit epsilon
MADFDVPGALPQRGGGLMFYLFGGKTKATVCVDGRTPITAVPYVVFDTELTGLDEKKDAIVSLGAVRMTGGTIHLGETFYRLVNPRKGIAASSVLIHEITPADVQEQPGIETALRDFLGFCGQAVLVGHFVSIDRGFLDRALRQISGKPCALPVIDTFSMYTWLRQRLQNMDHFGGPETGVKLYDIAKCFSIAVAGAHNALQDAFITAQLLQRFLPLLGPAGVMDIADLLRIGTPFEGGDHHRPPIGEFSNF